MILNCRDKKTEQRHLKEKPLNEGWVRHYYDHTGRFFNDYSPEEWKRINEPNEISDLLKQLISKEINNQIINKLK